MKEIRVQALNNNHSSQAVDLILNIQQGEFGLSLTILDQPDLLDIEKYYKESGGQFWGAFFENRLVGTIAIIKFSDTEGAIRKMFVAKEFRGKEFGIAQLLLEQLTSYCRENGISALYLGTQAVLKAAARFYEKNGFDLIDKIDLPAAFPLMPVDNRFYRLRL